MCLGAVKPHSHSFGFGFHVGSKIYRVLKQKVLYVQKLWKSLLTHGINRKHFCPKLSWTELFFLTGFAGLLLGSAGSKALTTFFRNTLKQECSFIFSAFHLNFLVYQIETFVFSKWSIYQIFWKMIYRIFPSLGPSSLSWGELNASVCLKPSIFSILGWAVDALCLFWLWRTLEKFLWRNFVPNPIFLTKRTWTGPSQGCLCYRTGLISHGDYCVLLEDPCDDQISRNLQKP